MSLYPINIKRCQHIKINGTQCGSPALRDSKCCYYHIRYHWPELEKLEDQSEWRCVLTPTLEDANSIQVSLANVMHRLIMQEIDHKTAALLLYALQTASMNLKRTSLEPAMPTQVVIDRESVANRPIGATAWSRVEGREYDEIADNDEPRKDSTEDELDPESRRFNEEWTRLVIGNARDPNFLDKPHPTGGTLNPAKESTAEDRK